ncbi:E-selectin-like [Diabrotica undecimpunctata]|uniref:E-selectin-like n=1 Tax=Diabrotica undecimpunctata TaxID=50387 RepID=UPI003B634439
MYRWCVSLLLFIFPVVFGANGNGNCGCCEGNTRDVIPSPVTSYQVLTTPVSHKDAIAACQAIGMSLVSIQTKEKSDAVNTAIQANHLANIFWTSGQKIGNSWFWLKGEPFVFTNWNTGEPNNAKGNENCLTVFKSGAKSLWNDDSCDVKLIPVCEKVVSYQNEGSSCGCTAPVINIFVDRAH